MNANSSSSFNPPSGSIDVDAACKRCGYNLRGLPEDGRCPECGTPVSLSMRGDQLRFSDPNWLDKVATGLGIIFWMMVLGTVGGLLVGLVSARNQFLAALLGLVASAINVYGVWLLTERDPSHVGEDKWAAARRAVRVTLIIGLVAYPLQFVLATPGVLRPEFMVLIAIVIALVSLIGLYGQFATFQYYEWLARRVPDHKLGDRARFLRWAYVITLAVAALLGAALGAGFGGVARGGMAPTAGGLAVLGCVAVPIGLAVLVFGVMTFFMIWRLRWHVKQQSIEARANWTGTQPPAIPPLPT